MLFLVVFAGCGRQEAPQHEPVDNRYGAPQVESPRDVRSFADDPCSGPIISDNWPGLGFSASGEQRTLTTGERSCVRQGPERQRRLSFIVVPSRDVLVDAYRVRQFALFRPSAVGGLPAAVEQSSLDSLSCSVTVGTAEGQGFVLNYSEYSARSNDAVDPCSAGRRVAEHIVAGLPLLSEK
ncbi:DUF3558 family protein [Actinomycetospora cinnamomea]|uniref:DUF3558 family protein n=1 Tax=Actinomycetospora cinnamomea TaxID=663609 RepID=UPI003C2DB83F